MEIGLWLYILCEEYTVGLDNLACLQHEAPGYATSFEESTAAIGITVPERFACSKRAGVDHHRPQPLASRAKHAFPENSRSTLIPAVIAERNACARPVCLRGEPALSKLVETADRDGPGLRGNANAGKELVAFADRQCCRPDSLQGYARIERIA